MAGIAAVGFRRTLAAAASSSSSSSASSETALGILQLLEERQAADTPEEELDAREVLEGRVLSSGGGLLRVSMPGRVAVGGAVDLPDGLGVLLRYDRRGTVVAVVAGTSPGPGELVRAAGVLAVGDWPLAGKGADSARFASVTELLRRGSRSVVALPAMPSPPSRRPVSRRMPSGLAAVEALLPLGEGHRVALVGPPTTGKSRAAAMIVRSQTADTAVVYAAQRSRAALEASLGEGVLDSPNLHVLHADPVTTTAAARYLLPLCAVQLAARLRSQHRHVLLILDDISAFAQAASELGTPPLGAPQVVAAALDAAGNVESPEGLRALSVAVIADFDPEDDELHSSLRNLWRSAEPSLDVCLPFRLDLAADGIMPAIDLEQLFACGPPPVYQASFFKAIRVDLMRALIANRDRRERLEVSRQLGLHIEPQDQEEQGSSAVARALFAHAAARPPAELAVILTSMLVFHFPLRGRKPSRSAVMSFQEGVLGMVQEEYPGIWAMLQQVEQLSQPEAAELLQQLARALLAHRFSFQLTSPDW